MRTLVVLGHPRTDSYCGSLARSYVEGARDVGVDVRLLSLGDLEFDPHVQTECPSDQPLEPDLEDAAAQIQWADHLVFVYPNWWGTMPALLKGFFDRVFMPGFAFEYFEDGDGAGHRKLLDDMTAELVVTMDVPPWVYRWIQREPGTNAVKRATLGYSGIRTTRTTYLGPIETSTADRRRRWLERIERLGSSLHSGPDSRRSRVKRRFGSTIGALRLQFYPMAWIAYLVGAIVAAGTASIATAGAFWAGFGFIAFLEAATVLSNEYVDYETDRRNTFAGPFTGGSRVLVDGELGFRSVAAGAIVAGLLATVSGLIAISIGAGDPVELAAVSLGLAVLALGYTLPPLKLSYRTLGELDVAVTHSLGVLLLGYVVAGGTVTDPTPWLVSLPFVLAVVPSITLAGVPDRSADRAVGKRTIAARFGFDVAAAVAAGAAILAVATALAMKWGGLVDVYGLGIYLAVPHAAIVVWLVLGRVRGLDAPRRIDVTMVTALTFITWFALVPLLELL